jgi:hypothetical protein
MKSRRFPLLFCIGAALAVCLYSDQGNAMRATQSKATQAQAIAAINSILGANAGACKLKHGPISARRIAAGWRVTTRVTLNGRGRAFTSTAVWTVREGEAVPGNQLTAEISNGCP